MTLLKNARIIDGTSSPAFTADILIDNDTIKKIKKNIAVSGCESVDIAGNTLCPGFIDIHAHSELEALRNPSMSNKIIQGITTDISGNCGVGVYPRNINDNAVFQDILGHYNNWNWTDFSSFKTKLKSGINMGFLQAHSNLRYIVLGGNAARKATTNEINKMCSLLDISLSQGCIGFSTGLYYAPCVFAEDRELEMLLEVVKKHDAIFAVHHRCEGDLVLKSIDEVINLAEKTNVKLEISHLKAIGKDNQNKVIPILNKIHNARERGLDVAFDQYPYNYGSTSLFSLLPPELLRLEREDLCKRLRETIENKELFNKTKNKILNPDGWDSIVKLCGFDNITVLMLDSNPQYNNLTLSQCADKLNCDCFTALFKLLSIEKGAALMKDITETNENLETIMKDNLMSFGTDALYSGDIMHPRSTEAATHLLEQYVYNSSVLKEEEAIYRMTLKNAEKLKIKNRGKIAEGYKADIVAYNPKTVKELDYVIVNGTFAIKNKNLTGSVTGSIL